MTIVEFFDKEPLENVSEALLFSPDRIVLCGKDYKKMELFRERMEQIIKARELQTQIEIQSVNTTDYFAILDMLTMLSDRYPDCLFDITGGSDTVLVAMGAVAHAKGLPLRTINPRNGSVRTFSPPETDTKEIRTASLSVAESLCLFGGTADSKTLIPTDIADAEHWKSVLFMMWDILKENCSRWNAAVEYFASFIPSEDPDFDGVTVFIPKSRLENGLKSNSAKTNHLSALLEKLTRSGIVQKAETHSAYRYTFASPLYLAMLSKSGNVLELYTYLAASCTKTKDGTPLFNDLSSGVVIDWEYPPDENEENNVENEIDVLGTMGVIPVFISCKNGGVDSNELYKLNTVATRFGGEYAKKLLVMTHFNVPDSFIQRSQAMNIKVIRDVHTLSFPEFVEKLKNCLR